MNATVSLDRIWDLMQSLSSDNKKWLAEKLYAEVKHEKEAKAKALVFPRRNANQSISPIVKEMTVGKLPEGFDFEQETEKMWEEWAR